MEISHCGIRYLWNPNSFLSLPEARYALKLLWRLCAGEASWEGSPAVEIAAAVHGDIKSMFSVAPGVLPWVCLRDVLPRDETSPFDTDSLPGLCWVKQTDICRYQGQGQFPLDLVAAVFLFVTGWEEKNLIESVDEWGNCPSSAMLAARQGFLDRPVLDEWALVIRKWLECKSVNWRAILPSFRIYMTHDIDHPYKFTSLYRLVRILARDILRDHSLYMAARDLVQGIRSRIRCSTDPFCQGLRALMDLDEFLGVRGTFFFMTASPGRFDEGYSLSSPKCRALLEEVTCRGHEVGWHPGYRSTDDKETFWREKTEMDALMKGKPYGARIHYLRWRVGVTWRLLSEAGCLYDASLGFNETVGFRCGTAQRFDTFDLSSGEELLLEERPFAIQDNALFHCMGLRREEMAEKVRILSDRVKTVRGELGIVIHNSRQEVEDKASSFFRDCLPAGAGRYCGTTPG